MAIPNNYIDKITDNDTGESRLIYPPAEHVRVENENFDSTNLDDVLTEMQRAIDEAASQGGIQQETDPTVPSWAKRPNPPSPQEIGAVPSQGYVPLSQDEKDKLDALPTSSELNTQLGGKADKSTTYTKTETDNAIANAVEGLGGGSVESVTINGVNHEPINGVVDLGTIQGQPGAQGPAGNTYLVDENFDPVSMIINNLDESDGTVALSARQGRILKQAISTVQANLQAVVDALANLAFTDAKPALNPIDWTGGTFYATINKSLTGCTATDNTNNGQIAEGSTLTMQLTASSGHTLTGATISVTNSKGQAVAYTLDNNNTLTIAAANVVGTINISVVAVAIYSVVNNDTNVNLTASTMSPTSGSSWTGTLAIKSGISNYRLASAPVVTMGGTDVDFSASGNSWDNTTGVMTIGSVTGNIVITSASVEIVAHKVTNHFINMASTGDGYVDDGDDYTAVLSPATGATSNGDLRVFVDGEPLESTDYTFDSATGALTIPSAKITGDVDVCATASTGKITITVKAGMSTTVKLKETYWASTYFYDDTIDASGSAVDVTEVINNVPTANGVPTVSIWEFGTKEAIKGIDFGGCKTSTDTKSKLSELVNAEYLSNLAFVETPNNAAQNIQYFFTGDKSLVGGLDLMTWKCDTQTNIYNMFSGDCSAHEVILPYLPGLTHLNNALAGSKVKRFVLNKTGTINYWKNFINNATEIEYIDISRAKVILSSDAPWGNFSGQNTGYTLKIGEIDVSQSPSSNAFRGLAKLICTTSMPPNDSILLCIPSTTLIYVPDSSVNIYKTTWADFAANIHSINDYTEP